MRKSLENDRARLQHMLDNAQLACQFAEGKTRDDLDTDDQLRLALDKDVEIIGEAACHVTDELQAETCQIPWNDIKGTRLIVAHRYYELDPDILWETVIDHLPPLILHLKTILDIEN